MDDGYILYNPAKKGQRIDVTGGWHDATDYLQYTATSANAVSQLLLSYRDNPKAFGDGYQANGLPGPTGIPDIIDEAKWGMDWLKKMNPSPSEYYNQIADDRDHAGFRLPNKDSVVYDPNKKGRPVYLASGEKQGAVKYKNRSTG
ncbi:MAG: glycoside hydrolase family 9 protein, partial [Allomuricauda sp.]